MPRPVNPQKHLLPRPRRLLILQHVGQTPTWVPIIADELRKCGLVAGFGGNINRTSGFARLDCRAVEFHVVPTP